MSPEQSNQTPEQGSEKLYIRKAQEVITEATAHAPETEDRFQAVDAYVTDILEAANNGEITGSHGTYTKEQLQSQIRDFLSENRKSEEKRRVADPYRFIPSANGLRSAFRSIMSNEDVGLDFELALNLQSREAEEGRNEELITSEMVQKIGAAELRAAGVAEPGAEMPVSSEAETPKITKQEYLATLADGISEDDLRILEDYASSKLAQNRAASNGEYDNVAHWKREAYNDSKRLSGKARAIADQYAHAFNYYGQV